MLQRVPMILAVTAASYGLPLQGQAATQRLAAKEPLARQAPARQGSAHTQSLPQAQAGRRG